MDTFGEILVKIRKSCGLTQSELAKKMTELGFSTSSNMVSKWEINYAVPNVLQFFGLCKIMNIYDINSAFHVTETKDPSFILRFQAGILGYSIAGMKAFEGKFSYKNQPFS